MIFSFTWLLDELQFLIGRAGSNLSADELWHFLPNIRIKSPKILYFFSQSIGDFLFNILKFILMFTESLFWHAFCILTVVGHAKRYTSDFNRATIGVKSRPGMKWLCPQNSQGWFVQLFVNPLRNLYLVFLVHLRRNLGLNPICAQAWRSII